VTLPRRCSVSQRFFSSRAWRFLARHRCCLKRAAARFLARRSAGVSLEDSLLAAMVSRISFVLSKVEVEENVSDASCELVLLIQKEIYFLVTTESPCRKYYEND
jgi:hypothetical protein